MDFIHQRLQRSKILQMCMCLECLQCHLMRASSSATGPCTEQKHSPRKVPLGISPLPHDRNLAEEKKPTPTRTEQQTQHIVRARVQFFAHPNELLTHVRIAQKKSKKQNITTCQTCSVLPISVTMGLKKDTLPSGEPVAISET